MKGLKRFYLIIVMLAVTLTMAGCGQNIEESGSDRRSFAEQEGNREDTASNEEKKEDDHDTEKNMEERAENGTEAGADRNEYVLTLFSGKGTSAKWPQ